MAPPRPGAATARRSSRAPRPRRTPAPSRRSAQSASPSSTAGIARVAEVAREERALDADRAHPVEHVLPGRLPAERRAERALEQAAAVGERDLVLDREVLARELRVRDDDPRDALLERARRPPRTCRRGRGARWRGQPVPCDRPQHVARLGQQPPVVAGHVHRLDRRGRARAARAGCCAQSGTWSPGFGSVRPAVSAGESTVGIQTMRAPSRAAISTASAFMPPTARFSVSVPSTSTPGHETADDLRPLGGRGVVRLECEAGEARPPRSGARA